MKKLLFHSIILGILILTSCTKGKKGAESSINQATMGTETSPSTDQRSSDSEPRSFVSYPTPVQASIVSPDGIGNIRKEPTMDSPIVKELGNGANLSLIGKSGNWYKVQSGTQIGYIHQNVVREISEEEEVEHQSAQIYESEMAQRKNMVRESPERYIQVKLNYDLKGLGGIKNGIAYVKNESEFMMKDVIVRISYHTDNGYFHATHDLTFPQINPGQVIQQVMPSSDRGSSARYKIENAYIP